LVIKGDARRMVEIDIAGEQYLVVAVNNGALQVFRIANWFSRTYYINISPPFQRRGVPCHKFNHDYKY